MLTSLETWTSFQRVRALLNSLFLFSFNHFTDHRNYFEVFERFGLPFLCFLNFIEEISAWRLVFWNSIHQEVASDSFCFLLYSSWLIVFILYVFEHFFSFINLYCCDDFISVIIRFHKDNLRHHPRFPLISFPNNRFSL